jgi:hypothetical protein
MENSAEIAEGAGFVFLTAAQAARTEPSPIRLLPTPGALRTNHADDSPSGSADTIPAEDIAVPGENRTTRRDIFS